MGSVQSKVSYLQGLAKGLDFSAQSVEGKLLMNMVDVLNSIAEELHEIQLSQKDLEDYVDNLDEDLETLESLAYDNDTDVLRVECPNCNAEIVFEPVDVDDTVVSCQTASDYENSCGFGGIHRTHPGI